MNESWAWDLETDVVLPSGAAFSRYPAGGCRCGKQVFRVFVDTTGRHHIQCPDCVKVRTGYVLIGTYNTTTFDLRIDPRYRNPEARNEQH